MGRTPNLGLLLGGPSLFAEADDGTCVYNVDANSKAIDAAYSRLKASIDANVIFVYTGPLSGIPSIAKVGQLAFITDALAGQNVYECASPNAWTQQVTATGSIAAVQNLDVSTYAGSDLGAKINAAVAAAPAAGCILNLTNLASPQTISTAVNISGPHKLFAAGMTITLSAKLTLSGNGSSVVGAPGRTLVLNKGANLDPMLEISGNDVVIESALLDGKIGSGFTGNVVKIDNGVLRPIFSNTTIQGAYADAINDQGSTDLNFFNCNINTYGVNGYNQTLHVSTNPVFHHTTITDSSTSTGSAIVNYNSRIVLDACRIACVSTFAPAINGGTLGGTIELGASTVSQTGLNSALSATGGVFIINASTISGGGSSGSPLVINPCISNSSGQLALISSTVTGAGQGYAISWNAITSGHFIIADCQLSQNMQGSGAAIIYLTGDSIGYIIHHNSFKMGDNAPTGDNYCIWYAPTGTHAIEHTICDNIFYGGPTSHDVGIFLDNTANVTTAGGITIGNNKFIDIGGSCINRNDTVSGSLATTFFNNFSQDGPLFGPTSGDTGANDTIIQLNNNGWTPSSYPACGSGIIFMSGTATNPVRADASYSGLVQKSGAATWAALRSPEVGFASSTSLSANSGAIVLFTGGSADESYVVNWQMKLTTVAGSGCTLGPFLLNWTDPDGVSRGYNSCAAQSGTGTIVTSDTQNDVTKSFLTGLPLFIRVKAGTQVLFAAGISSSGSAPIASYSVEAEIR